MLEMQECLHTPFLLAVILIHQNGSQYYYYDFVYSLLTVSHICEAAFCYLYFDGSENKEAIVFG